MAENPTSKDDFDDIDDLLNFDDDEQISKPDLTPAAEAELQAEKELVAEVPAPVKRTRRTRAQIDADNAKLDLNNAQIEVVNPTATESINPTPDQIRIKELEAMLAAPAPVTVEEVQLTPDQLRIRELEDLLAKKNSKDLDVAPEVFAPEPTGDSIVLHFVNDGFVACGRSWYRGQELEFEIGGKAYEQQKDRDGNSWLDIVDDMDAQYARFGQQMFAPGPWRGHGYEEEPLPDDLQPNEIENYKAALKAATNAERKRGRKAPIL